MWRTGFDIRAFACQTVIRVGLNPPSWLTPQRQLANDSEQGMYFRGDIYVPPTSALEGLKGLLNGPTFLKLAEQDYHELSLAASMDPKLMPAFSQLESRLTPRDLAVLKRYHALFYGLQAVDQELEDRANHIFWNLIPRDSSNGGRLGMLPSGYLDGKLLTIELDTRATPDQITRARHLGLPLKVGGRLKMAGQHNVGRLLAHFPRYHHYYDNEGGEFLSLRPLYGATPEEIVDLYRFIEERTKAGGILSKLEGVHFYRREPRLLFEILKGKRMFNVENTDPDLPQDFERDFDSVMSTHLLRHKSAHGRFGDDVYLEEDYMYISDGRLRIGLPVRAGDFAKYVKAGKVFRLTDD